MASLPLFVPSASLPLHFLPQGPASLARPKAPLPAPAVATPSSPHSRPLQPSLSPAEPGPVLPRSLFDPLRSARQPSSTRPRGVAPRLTVQTRSLFDPLPPVIRESLTSQPTVRISPASDERVPPVPSHPVAAGALARTEAALREAGLAGQCWRGDALSTSPLPSTPSGFRLLDEELPGGGWPARCLIELLLSRTGVGEIRFLAATLSALTQAGRQIVLLAPPHGPDPTGWEQLGIDMRRVLVVRTERPADRLWAIEQSLKSSAFGALLAWLPEEKVLARHDALRRLQTVAAAANGLSFLLRPAAAQFQASPAPLRLTLATGRPDRDRRTLSVRLIKRRGPVLAQPLTLSLPEVHRGMRVFGLAGTAEDSAVPRRAGHPVDGWRAPDSIRSSRSDGSAPEASLPDASRLAPSIPDPLFLDSAVFHSVVPRPAATRPMVSV